MGETAAMQRLRSTIETIAWRTCTVLVRGESGSGKELVARHIHACSARADKPFIAVDCTTLKDTLFESQLFGHVKGAFTGAEQATLGLIRSADGGTLFLDEIGELPPPVQAKLLRCIQERTVMPLGGTVPVPVDVRVVVATHRDLRAMVRRGEFREDLYFRLNVVQLTVPPLRERKADIALLATHLLSHFAEFYHEPGKTLSAQALRCLEAYPWPGNVRELANTMEQVHVLADHDVIEPDDLPEEVRPRPVRRILDEWSDEIPTMEVAEKHLLTRALAAAHGNQSRAARILKVDRRRLRRRIRAHGLQHLTRPQ